MKKKILLSFTLLLTFCVLGQTKESDNYPKTGDGEPVPPKMAPSSQTNQYSNNQIGTEYDFVLNDRYRNYEKIPLDKDALIIYDYDGTIKSFNIETKKVNWTFAASDSTVTYARNKMTLEDGVLYVPFHNGELYALNHKTGQKFWEVKIGLKNGALNKMMINQIPVIHGDKLYFVTQHENKNIYALNKKTGRHIWNYQLEYPYNHMPVLYSNEKIFVPNAPYFYSFDAETGKALYARGFKTGMYSRPVSDGKRIFIADLSRDLFALDPEKLDILWKKDLPEGAVDHKMVYENNQLLLATSHNFYALNPETGAVVWQTEVPKKEHAESRFTLKQLELFNNKIYAYNNKSTFFVVNSIDGKIEKEIDLQNDPISNIQILDENTAFFYCEVGLIKLNLKTKKEDLLYIRSSIQSDPKENYILLVR
ncbi:PQQ-like beta-propeller repeat protein [Myroides marinus]|uniref:PQQ-binding-like beta-propeller repeat protein n=1 Tax=Myroides marinus TaxID=703342 RepID=UPI002574DD7F|nr:PQQ-binding-like beta-propeller repeat protein [Myroides marinus]MDM1350272.1 PQQ-like beta-propeller repeat protein [Myroides marinus]MDM1357479.1 PQQ-like beta-propeller repeat protein [Myroides marinus]MDM1364118.1 PQQ-like beta-propeller repeat protein [Myroides marinus]MDM1371579.1 PQQ-like beta-propeller repeat protein [Myroides marinus]MDM1383580.1 PQQ-like beta-propeller repeat protein [Myroides marinus]